MFQLLKQKKALAIIKVFPERAVQFPHSQDMAMEGILRSDFLQPGIDDMGQRLRL